MQRDAQLSKQPKLSNSYKRDHTLLESHSFFSELFQPSSVENSSLRFWSPSSQGPSSYFFFLFFQQLEWWRHSMVTNQDKQLASQLLASSLPLLPQLQLDGSSTRSRELHSWQSVELLASSLDSFFIQSWFSSYTRQHGFISSFLSLSLLLEPLSSTI